MEVLISIPKDLEKYIEYLPEKALPNILSDIIKESIISKIEEAQNVTKKNSYDLDLGALANMLQQNTLLPVVKQEEVELSISREIEEVPKVVEEVRVETVDLGDDDDDLSDFLDMMK